MSSLLGCDTVTVEKDEASDFQVIRYLFRHPANEELRVTLIDYIRGFTARAEGNGDVIAILQQMLNIVSFTN